MKKTILAISCIALASVVVVSCKKKDDDNNNGGGGSSKTKLQLLTDHEWQATDMKINGTSVWETLIEDCTKDDFQKFNTDGSGYIDAGIEKCDTSENQRDTVAWKFLNNETVLVFDEDTANIAELGETKMRLTMESPFGPAEIVLSKK